MVRGAPKCNAWAKLSTTTALSSLSLSVSLRLSLPLPLYVSHSSPHYLSYIILSVLLVRALSCCLQTALRGIVETAELLNVFIQSYLYNYCMTLSS